MRIGAALVASVLWFSGCSSSAPEYEDADALAAALRAEDLACATASEPVIEAGGEGAPTSSGSCSLEGEGVQLFVFETEDDADLWFERGRMETLPTARGANWVAVPESQDTADRIAEALGGDS